MTKIIRYTLISLSILWTIIICLVTFPFYEYLLTDTYLWQVDFLSILFGLILHFFILIIILGLHIGIPLVASFYLMKNKPWAKILIVFIYTYSFIINFISITSFGTFKTNILFLFTNLISLIGLLLMLIIFIKTRILKNKKSQL